jgi:hypothetical protein
MKISFEEQSLLTVGDDGCFCVLKLQDREGRPFKKEVKDTTTQQDEILVTKSDLKEHYSTMTELKRKVDELKADCDSQLKMKDFTHESKLAELFEKFKGEISELELVR